MKAVKAGYSFNLFTDEEISHIELKKLDGRVIVEGEEYPLYCGTTFAESQKVDDLLDRKGELPLRNHRVKEEGRER